VQEGHNAKEIWGKARSFHGGSFLLPVIREEAVAIRNSKLQANRFHVIGPYCDKGAAGYAASFIEPFPTPKGSCAVQHVL